MNHRPTRIAAPITATPQLVPIIDTEAPPVKRGMRIGAMQTRDGGAPTIRPLPLPGAEPRDADAYREIHAAGGHFLLCNDHKRPFVKEWQKRPAGIDDVLRHAGRGGLVGVVPGSLGAVVVDLDPEGADDTTPPLGAPVLQHATRRKGTHFWYRAPDGEVRNRKWARTAGGQHVGDVRGSRGFCILWDTGAIAAAVAGDDFAMADPVDVSTLPWPKKGKGGDVEQMRAAKNGERNDLFNRLAFARAQRGENMATLRTAALEAGLSVAEVDATIKSAEEGAARDKLTVIKAGAEEVMSEADLGTRYMKLHKGDRLHRSDGEWFRWHEEDGWQLDSSANTTLAEVMRLGRAEFWRLTSKGPKPDPTTGGRVSTSRGALTYARAECWSDTGEWDTDPWLVGAPGGQVVDLRNGTMRARTRTDLIERSVAAVPAQEWRETRWDTCSCGR